MEYFDLYDKDRNPTGEVLPRDSAIPEGKYHLVVFCCVFNSKGEMLIQQRQPFKKNWSGLWDLSVGGSVIAGESNRIAIERELEEEIGIKHDFSDARPKLSLYSKDRIYDIFMINIDVVAEDLILQPEEVKQVKWADQDEICRMINTGEFIRYKESFIRHLFDLRDLEILR